MKKEIDATRRVECGFGGTSVTVQVGEKFYYEFHRHGSAGEDSEFEISDNTVIMHERTESEYLHPERMKPGRTGRDAELCKWFFKALRPGKATLTVRTMYRFEMKDECRIDVTVVF
ncbi:MAG: hypothetical protein ACE5H4_14955 [Candidatus Thorarchaeota archaeon]